MVISFSNDKARAQLMQQSVVHNFRLNRRKKKQGKNWANSGRTTTKIADVYIKEVGYYSVSTIRTFVPTSGFSSLVEWWHAIQAENWSKLKKGVTQNTQGWLYKVTKVPEKLQEVVHYYKVTPPRGHNNVILPFTKQDLLNTYAELDVIPSITAVRDLTCDKGFCRWEDHSRLKVERLKNYKS